MFSPEFGRGVLAGIGLPIIIFFVLTGLFMLLENAQLVSDQNLSENFRERTTALVAIAANAVLLQTFRKKYLFDRMRGVVLSTFIFVAIWLVMFGRALL